MIRRRHPIRAPVGHIAPAHCDTMGKQGRQEWIGVRLAGPRSPFADGRQSGRRMKYCAAALGVFFLPWTSAVAQEAPPKFEAGVQFTALHFPGFGEQNTFGAGIRIAYNPVRFLSLEAELNRTFPNPALANNFTGGHLLQGFAGLKVGVRKTRFGIFGKIRPGFANFDSVVKSLDPVTFAARLGSRTQFSMDVGGVFEVYVTRRFSVRYDLGDTMIHYGRQFILASRPFDPVTKHNFQFSSGILFRF